MTQNNLEAASSGVEFLKEAKAELMRALEKHPGTNQTFAAMLEEFGEANMALLDHDRGEESPENIYKECVQTAAMALRLGLYGTAEYKGYRRPSNSGTANEALDSALCDALQAFIEMEDEGGNGATSMTRAAIRVGQVGECLVLANRGDYNETAFKAATSLAAAVTYLAVFGSREFPKYKGDGNETPASARARGVEKDLSGKDEYEEF